MPSIRRRGAFAWQAPSSSMRCEGLSPQDEDSGPRLPLPLVCTSLTAVRLTRERLARALLRTTPPSRMQVHARHSSVVHGCLARCDDATDAPPHRLTGARRRGGRSRQGRAAQPRGSGEGCAARLLRDNTLSASGLVFQSVYSLNRSEQRQS